MASPFALRKAGGGSGLRSGADALRVTVTHPVIPGAFALRKTGGGSGLRGGDALRFGPTTAPNVTITVFDNFSWSENLPRKERTWSSGTWSSGTWSGGITAPQSSAVVKAVLAVSDGLHFAEVIALPPSSSPTARDGFVFSESAAVLALISVSDAFSVSSTALPTVSVRTDDEWAYADATPLLGVAISVADGFAVAEVPQDQQIVNFFVNDGAVFDDSLIADLVAVLDAVTDMFSFTERATAIEVGRFVGVTDGFTFHDVAAVTLTITEKIVSDSFQVTDSIVQQRAFLSVFDLLQLTDVVATPAVTIAVSDQFVATAVVGVFVALAAINVSDVFRVGDNTPNVLARINTYDEFFARDPKPTVHYRHGPVRRLTPQSVKPQWTNTTRRVGPRFDGG